MTILHILKWWSNGKKLANFFSLHLSSIKCVRIAIYYCAIWISHPNSVDAPVADSADCTKKMLFSDCKIISQVKICKNNEINTGFSISYIRFFNQRKDSMDHKVTKKPNKESSTFFHWYEVVETNYKNIKTNSSAVISNSLARILLRVRINIIKGCVIAVSTRNCIFSDLQIYPEHVCK